MLQIKSLHDPRRPRTNMTGCPARLHNATSPIAGRASPTSGTWRPGFVGLAGGSGRALAGGRAHRGLGGAHWLSKQGAPVGLNCRAVAVETRSARDVPLSTQPSSSDDSETPLALRSVPCLREDDHGTEAGPPFFEGDREHVAATTRPSRPRLPSREFTFPLKHIAMPPVQSSFSVRHGTGRVRTGRAGCPPRRDAEGVAIRFGGDRRLGDRIVQGLASPRALVASTLPLRLAQDRLASSPRSRSLLPPLSFRRSRPSFCSFRK